MRKQISNRRPAFTLIEMVLNLVIMMLLAAILFPVVSRVRENARRSSCQSNLKQLGLAFMLYAQDFDEKLPPGTIPEPSPYLGQGWATQVKAYVQNPSTFQCPSDRGSRPAPMVPISYAFNNNLVRVSTNSNTLLLRPLSSFTEPTRTVLCTEVRWGMFNPTLNTDTNSPVSNGVSLYGAGRGNGPTNLQIATGLFTNSPPDGSNCNNRDMNGEPFAPAHFGSSSEGGANYLGADGHVKWFRPESISAGAYPTQPNRPQSSTTAESVQYNGADKHAMTYSHY